MTDDRYNRHEMIDWFDQQTIRKLSVIVVGSGAVGNEVIKNLCLLGIGHIHIIDYERIEIHNLTRSVLFSETDVGQFKCEVAARSCQRIDPNVKITYDAKDFWHSLTIDQLKKYDALFCCVDNFEARIRLNQLCLIAKIDLFNAAIDSRSVCVEKYPFSTNPECACYECCLPPSVYTKLKKRYSCGWLRKRSIEEKKIPTTVITASVAGSKLCSLFLQKNHIDSIKDSISCYTDTITLNSTVMNIQRSSDCPACSIFSRECYVFKSNNKSSLGLLQSIKKENELVVWLSEKVILSMICKECGKRSEINDIADNHDELLLNCVCGGLASNAIDLRDSITFTELESIFGNTRIPVKFLYFHKDNAQYIIELED